MFRGVFACGVVGAFGQPVQPCSDCTFDVSALENFSANFEVRMFDMQQSTFTTSPLPPMLPTEQGSIAVDARNFYAKLDSHLQFPTPFTLPSMPMLDLSGHQIHEELHVNGIAGTATYHLESQMLNACIRVDLPPAVTAQVAAVQPMMDAQLQQVEAMASMMVQQVGMQVSIDGEDGIMLMGGTGGVVGNVGFSKTDTHPLIAIGNPGFFGGLPVAVKFMDYSNSAGEESIRPCEIGEQEAMQSFLSSNPDARAFVRSRVAQHQLHLQATLQPKSLNTRFNFVPLEFVDLLVPAEQHCPSALAETPTQSFSVAGSVVLGLFSFSMGVAVSVGLVRQRKVALADQVSA